VRFLEKVWVQRLNLQGSSSRNKLTNLHLWYLKSSWIHQKPSWVGSWRLLQWRDLFSCQLLSENYWFESYHVLSCPAGQAGLTRHWTINVTFTPRFSIAKTVHFHFIWLLNKCDIYTPFLHCKNRSFSFALNKCLMPHFSVAKTVYFPLHFAVK
jgi:hypothetical protein